MPDDSNTEHVAFVPSGSCDWLPRLPIRCTALASRGRRLYIEGHGRLCGRYNLHRSATFAIRMGYKRQNLVTVGAARRWGGGSIIQPFEAPRRAKAGGIRRGADVPSSILD